MSLSYVIIYNIIASTQDMALEYFNIRNFLKWHYIFWLILIEIQQLQIHIIPYVIVYVIIYNILASTQDMALV